MPRPAENCEGNELMAKTYCVGIIGCGGMGRFHSDTYTQNESDLPEPASQATGIYGTEGQIKTGKDRVVLLLNNKTSDWQEIKPHTEETDEFQELIDWMEGKIPECRSSGHQVRYTMEIMMAIYESLRVKNLVRMPFETKESPLDMMIEDGSRPVLKEGRYDIRRPFPEQNR